MSKVWIIYDGRAWANTDKASVYCAYSEIEGETLEEVKAERDKEWPDGVIYEYDTDNDILTNGKIQEAKNETWENRQGNHGYDRGSDPQQGG